MHPATTTIARTHRSTQRIIGPKTGRVEITVSNVIRVPATREAWWEPPRRSVYLEFILESRRSEIACWVRLARRCGQGILEWVWTGRLGKRIIAKAIALARILGLFPRGPTRILVAFLV
jgi:hypothetical protein